MIKKDVIIIGAGIAGMTAAIYLKRFNIDVLLIEKDIPGGQLNKILKLKNYPGFLDENGQVLAKNIYEQVKELEIDYLNEAVLEVTLGTKKVVKTKSNEYECNQIIIATGRAPRSLRIKGEEELLGHGISYCAVCDGFFFKGKDVAVIGNNMTALENAKYLASLVNKCYIVCSESALMTESDAKEIESLPNIEILYNSKVKEFIGENALTSMKLDVSDCEKTIELQGAFISIGYEPNFKIASFVDLESENGYLKVNANCETSIEGVFAIGDAISKNLYQLTTAVSEGAIAANYIKKKFYK